MGDVDTNALASAISQAQKSLEKALESLNYEGRISKSRGQSSDELAAGPNTGCNNTGCLEAE